MFGLKKNVCVREDILTLDCQIFTKNAVLTIKSVFWAAMMLGGPDKAIYLPKR